MDFMLWRFRTSVVDWVTNRSESKLSVAAFQASRVYLILISLCFWKTLHCVRTLRGFENFLHFPRRCGSYVETSDLFRVIVSYGDRINSPFFSVDAQHTPTNYIHMQLISLVFWRTFSFVVVHGLLSHSVFFSDPNDSDVFLLSFHQNNTLVCI